MFFYITFYSLKAVDELLSMLEAIAQIEYPLLNNKKIFSRSSIVKWF